MEELPKAYNPKEVEDRIYKLWEESGFFSPEGLSSVASAKEDRFISRKFVTAIAPPNITGELHMGHALELSMQDILVRMKRMEGYKTLWIPGIDHAGIAAQNVVEKQLKKEGLSRHDLGREKFEQRVQEWKEKYGTAILDQFKKLGISVDWSRIRYTRDEKYEKAVLEAFNQYHKRGWIYKGYRVINWCVRCGTGISDLEVKHTPEKGKLYYIKYGPFTIATARPETKLGDTGLAVHPDDERYKDYIGKDIEIDSVDNDLPPSENPRLKKIKIKVVADETVESLFGTGIIKVTPAHDLTDFEISQRHNLPLIKIIDENGTMNQNAGKRYKGLKVSEVRQKIVKDLEESGLLEKVEDYNHNVGRCDRCDSIIEPLPSNQWFLKVSELAKLAKETIKKEGVKFHPDRWNEISLRWLENIRDWNISRQLWWGHKIPIEGEDDVLDTWFSSALWPFAVFGWPEKTKDLSEYYPTNFITSDRGIVFLWQIRMIFSGKFFMNKAPFSNIYIHPTVLTKDGKRMSKSLGTGIDPVDLIEKYGADALRFGLAYQNTGVQDMRFNEAVILTGKKFANKLWNIARYIMRRVEGDWDRYKPFSIDKITGSESFGGPMKTTAEEVTENINQYRFGDAAHIIYDYMWHQIADKYIEMSKKENQDNEEEIKENLVLYLINLLKLLHPFMPFITEEIWSKLPIKNKKLLLIEKWPH
ncbi:MAG: valyl-tRNA synthetase [Parcubacteria group bacterium Gr01-1014_2]|nr:MAG: valyl-tRNA synthetase [Parcubacteria group bacterium Gr01-1014_2]